MTNEGIPQIPMSSAAEESKNHTPSPAQEQQGDNPLPAVQPYLWTSAAAEYNNGEDCRFAGFEPCYTACIKDLEWRIKCKIDTLRPTYEQPLLAEELAPMLIQYCK